MILLVTAKNCVASHSTLKHNTQLWRDQGPTQSKPLSQNDVNVKLKAGRKVQ